MSWTLRRFQIVTAGIVALPWTVFWVVGMVFGQPPNPAMWVYSTAPWVGAALLVVNRWWSGTGYGSSALDAPGAMLVAAVATLPERRRREWGMAMLAELAEVRGGSARWRFALSSARATLWQRPVGGWPVLALAAGMVVAAVLAAGPVVGAMMPELEVFAASLVGIFGALVTVTMARATRVRISPLPALLVTGAVTAAIAMTVVFLRRDPAAAAFLPPYSAVILAAVLAGCLWVALAAPQPMGVHRLAPYLGVAAALGYIAVHLLLIRVTYDAPIPQALRQVTGLVAVLWPIVAPAAVCFVVAWVAGSLGRSFRSGVRAGMWAGAASMPLAYALWLYESLRMYTIDGGLLLFGDPVPEAENLSTALFICVFFVFMSGPPCTVFGATLGSRLSQANK